MKKVRKHFRTPGCCFHLQTEMVIDATIEWKGICCPFSSFTDDPDYCGPWCARYDEDRINVGSGATCLTTPGIWIATCQGLPIGEIVEETGGKP